MDGFAVATLLGQSALAVRQRLDTMAREGMRELKPEPEPEPGTGSPYSAGQRVVLAGLTSSSELNGVVGVVQRYDEAKGRYSIQLHASGDAKRTVAVKPQNLSASSNPGGAAAAAAGISDVPQQESGKGTVAVEEKVYTDAIYLSLLSHGLSVCLKPTPDAAISSASAGNIRELESQQQAQLQWVCSEIYLYNEGVDGYRQYRTTALPHGLTWDKTNGEIVGEWGEPSTKSGGASTPICLEYGSKGLELNFVKRNWEDASNPLAFITLFEPE